MLNKIKKIDNDLLLILWIYLNAFLIILDTFIPSTICSIVKYIILLSFIVILLIKNKFSISRRLLLFSIIYLLFLTINIMFVSYRYQVFVEGITNFLIFFPSLYIINDTEFAISKFLEKWKIFAQKLFFLLIPILFLYYFKIVDYSIFGVMYLPSILILSFCYFKDSCKEKKILLLIIMMLVSVIFLGSRISGLLSILIFFFCLLFIYPVERRKRFTIFLSLIIIFLLFLVCLQPFVSILLKLFQILGIDSRNLALLHRQLDSGNLFSNIYLSHRENIYGLLVEYLKNNFWLPNGFAITRLLTQGMYYHPHSFLFELPLVFGFPLAIILSSIIILKIRDFCKKNDRTSNLFLLCLIVFYFFRGIVDDSIFTNFASIMIFGLIFFYQDRNLYWLNSIIVKLLTSILWYFPKPIAHKILYFVRTRKRLDLSNPKTLNEKLQYLMIYNIGQKEADLADKYKVREYVEKRGYGHTLTKLYGVYKNADEIDLEKLPEKFVLKANNSSGGVYICTDKNNFDFEQYQKELNRFMKMNFGKLSLEYHYSMIEPCIICEEYLSDFGSTSIDITDYKFYCFNGKCDCFRIGHDRDIELKFAYYDLDWNYLNFPKEKFRIKNREVKRVKNFEKMVKMVEDLSKGFPFVRVDLYNCNGKIYFGEMTFTPHAGVIDYETEEAQLHFGKMLKLPINSSKKKNR